MITIDAEKLQAQILACKSIFDVTSILLNETGSQAGQHVVLLLYREFAKREIEAEKRGGTWQPRSAAQSLINEAARAEELFELDELEKYARVEAAKAKVLPPLALRERRVLAEVQATFDDDEKEGGYALVIGPRITDGLPFRVNRSSFSPEIWTQLKRGVKLLASCNADAPPGDPIYFWDISILEGEWAEEKPSKVVTEIIESLQEFADSLERGNREGR